MARPREFEIDEAARALLEVFWAKGYEGASLSDIEAATRLNKQSLYRVFESKRGMYLAALATYDRDHVAAARTILRQAADPPAGFATLLNGVVDSALASGDRRGCFLCNASIDQAPQDPETSGRVASMIAGLERTFAEALASGPGGVGKVDARRRARKIMAGYFGLRVLVRSGAAGRVLRDVVDQLLEDVPAAEKSAPGKAVSKPG